VQRPQDIGISTSAYAGRLLPAALERISEQASFAEIRSFGLHTLLSRRNRAEAQRAGLTYSVHGPFGYTGIWDLDEAERIKALDEHRRHLEASAEIGALLYVVHPDWRPEVKPRDPAVVTQLGRSFETLRDWQDELGVEIVVENMPGTGMSHFTHPGDLDLRGLGLVLDVGHASISGCLDEWLDDPRAPLRHLHVHDNRGEGDDDDPHLGLGGGVVDAAAVLAAARAAGASVVLEHDSDDAVRTSLARLRELGLL
jgi:sugar phosphate isomerase/epimerase